MMNLRMHTDERRRTVWYRSPNVKIFDMTDMLDDERSGKWESLGL
jgi:hypothetical protein